MSLISVLRLAALCISLLFGLVVLGLAAHWTQGTVAGSTEISILFNFEIVALLAGSLTILTLPVMLIVGATRRGAFTSMIVVELSVIAALALLWLISGALTADLGNTLYPVGCNDVLPDGISWCRQFFAIIGLSFVTWILLMAYGIVLLTFTIIAQTKGRSLWKVGVNEAVFSGPASTQPFQNYQGEPGKEGIYGMPVGTPLVAPQQYQYPPGGVPTMQGVVSNPTPVVNNLYSPQPTSVTASSGGLPQV